MEKDRQEGRKGRMAAKKKRKGAINVKASVLLRSD